MLDQQTKDTIKATAPVLADKGLDITMRMYDIMFSRYPEVKSLFNEANQHEGGQPLTLARAVHAYAENIDNLEALGEAVELMAHKHVSLGVKAEHYPIVGECLLEAISDVLSPPQEIIDAWAEGYQFLADILIDAEQKLYDDMEAKDGGWADDRPFIVDRKVKESDIITSFYLRPQDGGPIPSYEPGQFLTVKFDFDNGNTEMRNYSLSDAANGKFYRISVKREPAAREGLSEGRISNHLHDHVEEGDVIDLRGPIGNFTFKPDPKRPVVLLSGGVGMTPLVSMLKTIARDYPEQDVWYIHAARNSRVHGLREDVKNIAAGNDNIHLYTLYNDPEPGDEERCDRIGLVTADWLKGLLPQKDCNYYFCGPQIFMQSVYGILKTWNVPGEQIHFEFFGPAGALEDTVDKAA